MKRHKDETTLKIETKMLWMAFETFLDASGEKRRMEGITSKKFHFSFKQKICQIIKNIIEVIDNLEGNSLFHNF